MGTGECWVACLSQLWLLGFMRTLESEKRGARRQEGSPLKVTSREAGELGLTLGSSRSPPHPQGGKVGGHQWH